MAEAAALLGSDDTLAARVRISSQLRQAGEHRYDQAAAGVRGVAVVVTEEVVVVTEGVGSPVVMLAGSAAAGSVAADLVVPVSAVVQSVASAAGLAGSVQLR